MAQGSRRTQRTRAKLEASPCPHVADYLKQDQDGLEMRILPEKGKCLQICTLLNHVLVVFIMLHLER